MPQRRRWWPIVAIIAIALVLLQLAIFAFRNDSDEPADTDAASEAPVGESVVPSEGGASAGAPEDEPDEQTPVPTDGGYVDPEGEQEVQYEAAPGQFQGIEGMALNVGGDIAAVDPVQLTEAGALIPPSDVSRLGWYSASAVPGAEGAAGSSVITGHINYQGQGTGYAARFANMAVGEEFDVLIDGTPRTFRVTQAPYRLPKGSDFPPEVNDATGPNRLVLITCGGQFVGGALGYADNIITIAEPVAPPAPPAV
ncbi:class F sortase [Corynebacterium afermentans subsp. lipophilum]|nr:class F sortase [Corynebacterium afermentans subsp. lipophilum]